MVGGKQGRFPGRAFVALAVAEQHMDALASTGAAQLHGHAGADPQPVAQRPRRQLHARHALVADVAGEMRAVLVVPLQHLQGEEAAFGQGGVDAGAGMPLGQDETVPVRPGRIGRIHAQHLAVEHRDDVGDRQARAHVRTAARTAHADHMPAQPQSKLFRF